MRGDKEIFDSYYEFLGQVAGESGSLPEHNVAAALLTVASEIQELGHRMFEIETAIERAGDLVNSG